uniref:Peptidoglycan recognition protein family domain-containing protein n=1 Tax=Anopheles melas TaxID=34690 RepID=A0A182TR70_9DIPT
MNKFATILVLASICLAGVSAQCPRIVTRAQWGARAASTAQLPIRPAPWVVMHHTAGAACTTDAACAQQMRNIHCGVSLGHIASNYWLIGHRQAVATACPGNAFFNEIRNWPRFNPNV